MSLLPFAQPGPAVTLYTYPFEADNPALFLLKVFHNGVDPDSWFIEVYNRRTMVKKLTTTVYLGFMAKQQAYDEAKRYMAPYLKGEQELT